MYKLGQELKCFFVYYHKLYYDVFVYNNLQENHCIRRGIKKSYKHVCFLNVDFITKPLLEHY